MMRRQILVIAAVICAGVVAGAAGWHILRPHDTLAEARQLMARGDFRAAQLVLRGAVQHDPDRAEAHLRLGQVQMRLGDPTAAEKEFRAARAHGADVKVITPLLAAAVVGQHHDAEVLRDYAPDGLAPDQAAAVLVARADAQMGLSQPDAAAASLAQAQLLAPRSVEVTLAAARMAMIHRDRVTAEARVDAALAMEPGSLEALMLQAELRAARGERTGALDSYDAAVRQATAAGAAAGGLETIRLARAELLIALDEDRPAREDVDAVLKQQPKSPMGQYLSAWLFMRAKDWKAADRALLAVGSVLPRLPRSDMLVAVVKANVGQPEQAIEAAEHQLARRPSDLVVLKLLARLHLAQQRPRQAAEVLAEAAAAGHSDAETLTLLGQIYAGSDQPQQALAAVQQALALAPEDTGLLTRLAALEVRLGESSEATATLERALDVTQPPSRPTDPPSPVLVSAHPGELVASVTPQTPTGPAPTAPNLGTPTAAQTAATLVMVALQAGEPDRAMAALERLRQANGDPGQIAMLSGLVKLEQVDLPGARAAFEEARRLDPASVPIRLNLARVLTLQGDPQAAAGLLDEALAADHANAAVLGAVVDLRLAQRQPGQAVAAAEAARAARPGDVGIAIGLATLYTRVGEPAKALALLDDVAKAAEPQQPPPPALVVARVRALLALGQRPAAVASLRDLLDRAPDDVTLRTQLAELMAGMKDFDGARGVLRDGLARRPGDVTLLAATIAVAGQEGGADGATARAAQLAGDPTNPLAVRQLHGELLMNQRRYAAAMAAYQTLLDALPPGSLEAEPVVVRLAGAVAAGGDPTRAMAMLRDWLGAHANSPAAALTLAGLEIGAHRLPDARMHLEAVLASQPNNPAALNNLAWVTQQTGDLPRAHDLALRGYLLSPTPQAADTLGWVMLAQDNPAAGLALLREASRGLPNDPGIQYHLASAMARNGQTAAARGVLQALLATEAGKPPTAFDERPAAEQLLHQVAGP